MADMVVGMVEGMAVAEGLEARLLIATVTRSQSGSGCFAFVQGLMSIVAFPKCRKSRFTYSP